MIPNATGGCDPAANHTKILLKQFTEMKVSHTVLACLFACTGGISFGQSSVTLEKILRYPKYSFSDTVRLDNVPKEELYNRAWNWFNEQAKTDPHFLEEASMRHGRFTGTTSIRFESKTKGGSEFVKGKIFFLVKITVADDYYVYDFTDFIHQGRITFNTITTAPKYPYRTVAGQEWHNMLWEEMKISIKDQIYPMIGNLRASMQKESSKFEELLVQRTAEIPLEKLQNAEIGKPSEKRKTENAKEKTRVLKTAPKKKK